MFVVLLSSATAFGGQKGKTSSTRSQPRVPKMVVDAGKITARPHRPAAVVELQRSTLRLRRERTRSFVSRIGKRLARSPL